MARKETMHKIRASVYAPNLEGRTLYVPQMCPAGSRLVAYACGSAGIKAEVLPDSDSTTLELGNRYLTGDECYPTKVTLGNILRVIEAHRGRLNEIAILMPTAHGPCRFGQYAPLMRKILDENGLGEVLVMSPTSVNGYEDLGPRAGELLRTVWRCLVAGDILRKMLLRIRPYEIEPGSTDAVYWDAVHNLGRVLSIDGASHKKRLGWMVQSLTFARDRFARLPIRPDRRRPLIAVVGEIYCRLDDFTNDHIVRKIEEHGGEAWHSGVAEWIFYSNFEQRDVLTRSGRRFSREMLAAIIKERFQAADEHALYAPFAMDLKGYEEPEGVKEILELSKPYLPFEGVVGEMVLSLGRALWLQKKGIDGVVDISPFSCMNGIVTEAIYPRVSAEHEGLPIRTFYFDGTRTDLDRDVGIFLELARSYKERKRFERVYPPGFLSAA